MRRAAQSLWARYEGQLASRPILTKTATRGSCFLIGDVAAQGVSLAKGGEAHTAAAATVADGERQNPSFDGVRTLAYSAWGAGYAPLQHYWFNFLSRQTASLSRLKAAVCRSFANSFGMVMLVMYPSFYIAVGTLRGDSITECLARARATFWSVFVADLIYWLPMEYSIFVFVPLRHQVLAFSLANCVFAVILSTLAQ